MTIFSQVGEYALRIMSALALEPVGSALRASDIAEKTGIPPAYVSKVLRRLTEAKLLESQKGHHGGFRLQKPASRIRFLDVLAAVDALPEHKSCVFGWGTCKAADPCPLHPAWSELSTNLFEWAKSTTLSDLKAGAALRPRSR